MKQQKYAITAFLVLLFIAAVLLRTDSARKSGYLYFDGTSGTNYRYAYEIGQTGSVLPVDYKAAWPEGIAVAQSRPLGTEYFVGYCYRLVKYFSEMEEREFVRLITRLLSSLLVFTLYALTFALWRNRAAALLAAVLVAFHQPLVKATDGTTFLHIQFAAVILSFHLLSFVHWKRGLSWRHGLLAAMSCFALLAVWEAAPYYIALFAVMYALRTGADPDKKRLFLVLQSAAFLAAAVSLPYWSAHRAVFSIPAAGIYAATIYAFAARRLPLRHNAGLASVLYVLGGTVILAGLFKPLRAGAAASPAVLEYFLYRLRYFFAKPSDPLSLPEAVRFMWTSDHASPSRYSMFHALFPLVPFLPAVIATAVTKWKKDRAGREERGDGSPPAAERNSLPILPVSLVALASVAMYISSNSTLVLAVPAVFPLLGLSIYRARKHILSKGIWIIAGGVLILSQAFSPNGRFDITRHAAQRLNFQPERGAEFVHLSLGDADQNLVRFLLRRTLVRDPLLALPDISVVLSTFAGRTTLLAPGIETPQMTEKTVSFVDDYYKTETEFFTACREAGIEYVVYSVEFVLDGSSYSPLYLAGRKQLPPASAAFRMHFFPEMLRHFALIYENDTYRLFKVTDEIQPIFTTDHPIIYQYSILDLNHDSLEQFHRRILNLLLLYTDARDEQARGHDQAALDMYNRCIAQAPGYTAARLGRASVLLSLGDLGEARKAYLEIIGYAPDNAEALYGLSLCLARLGETDLAEQYVEILLSSTGDKDMIEKAKLLKWFLEKNIPVESPDSLRSDSP